MKNKFILLTLIFLSFNIYCQEALIKKTQQQVITELGTFDYIFEGVVESVDLYAVDTKGNKLPNSAAIFENGNRGVGEFYDENGRPARCFSLAKIKVAKVYKGADIENKDYVYVQITSSNVNLKTQKVANEFKLWAQSNYVSHNSDEVLLVKHPGEHRQLFFSNKNKPSYLTVTKNSCILYFSNGYRTLDGEINQGITYAGSNEMGQHFFSEQELETFLSQIKGVNIHAKRKVFFDTKNQPKPATPINDSTLPKVDY